MVSLQRHIVTRLQYGEQVTELAAARIADLAREMGLSLDAQLQRLGFAVVGTAVRPLRRDALMAALYLVRKYDRSPVVYALCSRYAHLSVSELERA